METLVLECWIYLEDINNIFCIEIPGTKTVSDLKEAIKNKNPAIFGSVNARDLSLYTTPSSDDLEDQLKLWDPTGKTKLNGRKKLSLEFPEPDKAVIVCPPPIFVSRTSMASSVSDISLTCWTRGQSIDLVYVVKVSSSQTVADLKHTIKDHNKHTFSNLDASHLTLYKVSLLYPNDDASKEKFGSFSISTLEDKERLAIVHKKLSAIFSSPLVEENIHLIVEGYMPVRCWIRGAMGDDSFKVQTLVSATVDDLKNVIKAASEDLHEYPPHRLKLYRIQEDTDLPKALAVRGWGRLLHRNELLREIFDDIPFSCIPLVVVEQLEERIQRPPPVAYFHVGNDDPIATARAAFLKASPKDKPSAFGVPSSFRKRQANKNKAIPCGRPRDFEDSIPTTLLHPVFGEFLDDCRSIEPTDEDNGFVRCIADAMSCIYQGEVHQVEAITKEFQKYSMHFIGSAKNGYVMDGAINNHERHYVISEFKNETGSALSEPSFQVIGYYLESTRDTALKFHRSPLPCLLLSVFGPRMEFSGAAWNLRPSVQLLSTPLGFHFHSRDPDNQATVARHMAAFRKASDRLKVFYETLQEGIPPNINPGPAPPQIFPYPTSYRSLENGNQRHFRYVEEWSENRLIFLGESDDGRLCIKFVHTYSPDAHKHLASLGCAPELYGFAKLPGPWFMVVMKWLSEDFETLSNRSSQLPHPDFNDISAKLKSLHEAGYVHGDIRDTNILVSKEDEKRFMFIDFDWAGPVNKTKYPPGVNRVDIVRPEDARDGRLIKIEHDEQMLQNIISKHWC